MAALSRELKQLWEVLQVDSLKGSLPKYETAVAALVRQYAHASSSVAMRFYGQARKAAGVRGFYHAKPGTVPTREEVEQNVRWATRQLWSETPDVPVVQRQVEGATSRLVLNTGRDAVTANVEHDRQATGWARVPEPGCCAFCAMLAIRGAVYKTRKSATVDAEGHAYHDHCRCQPEPLFTKDYEPSEEIRKWQSLWASSTKGYGGKDARNAFRRAFES